jgi:hypothetical protein
MDMETIVSILLGLGLAYAIYKVGGFAIRKWVER